MAEPLSEGKVAIKLLRLILDSHVKIAASQRQGLFELFDADAEIWVRVERLRDLLNEILAAGPKA